MLELVFTSAKTGLIPGRSGFCSVAWTEGMPQNLVTLLENMSGYSVLYPPSDPRAADNPVVYSYQKVQYGQSELRILSRIAFAGLDHTGRSNKIAHHIILENDAEWIALQHGPVSAFLCEENFYSSWNDPPRLLPRRKFLRSAMTEGVKAEKWQELAGYAQWAGVIADRFAGRNEKSCLYLEYDLAGHGKNILYLIDEITRLLPREQAREFTFNTCFTSVSNNANCFFRAALPNCQALPAIRRFRADELISLITPPPLPEDISGSAAVAMAVSGKVPARESKPVMTPAQVVQLRKSSSGERVLNVQPGLVNQNREIRTIDRPFFVEQAKSEISSRSRLIIFSAAAFLLFAVITASILLFCLSPETPGSSDDEIGFAAKPADETRENVPSTIVEKEIAAEPVVKPVVKAEKKTEVPPVVKPVIKAEKKTEVPPVVKPVIKAEKKTEVPPVVKPVVKPEKKQPSESVLKPLTAAEKVELLKGFLSGTERAGVVIALPERLKKVRAIMVKMKDSWGRYKIADPFKFIKPESILSLRIYPAKSGNGTQYLPDWQSKESISVCIREGKLFIDDRTCKSIASPKKEHIKSIIFYCGDVYYVWAIAFDNDLLPAVKYGSFTVKNNDLKYEYSGEEKLFRKHGLSVEDNSASLSALRKKWNDSLEKLSDAAGKAKNKIPWDKAQSLLVQKMNLFVSDPNVLNAVCKILICLDDDSKLPEFLKKQYTRIGDDIAKKQKELRKNKDFKGELERQIGKLKYKQQLYANVQDKGENIIHFKHSREWLRHMIKILEKNKDFKKSNTFKELKNNLKEFDSKRKNFKNILKNESSCRKKVDDLYLEVKTAFPGVKKTESVSGDKLAAAANKAKAKYIVRKWKKAD